MKKLISLITTAVLMTGMLSSCSNNYHYDTDKAISLATEYMKDKYGKDVKDVETYKKTHGSDAYIGVKFKLDETEAESPKFFTRDEAQRLNSANVKKNSVKLGDVHNSSVDNSGESGIMEAGGIHAIQKYHKDNDPKWEEKRMRIRLIMKQAQEKANNYEMPSIYSNKNEFDFISECIAASISKKPSKTVRDVVSVILEV